MRNGKTAPRPWYRIEAKAEGEAEILIYDEITDPFIAELWGLGVSAKTFNRDLKALGDGITTLNVRINSPGGAVFEGQAIYSMLKAHKAKKVVHVDGLAASIASVIAMAGDEVIVPENAMLMIHNPSALVWGTADDMLKMAEDLEKIRESIVAVYVRKTGKEADEIKALMDAETWLTGAEAVELGFADVQAVAVQMAAAFDLSRFKNVPAAYQPAARAAARPAAAAEQPAATTEPILPTKEEPMITLQVINEQHPDIAAALREEGRKAAIAAEALRVKSIREVAAKFPGMDAVALELVELGVSADEAEKTFRARKLAEITNEAGKTAGGGSGDEKTAQPSHAGLEGEALWKAQWADNANGVKAEFLTEASYVAFMKANAAGRVRILMKKEKKEQ